MANMLSYHTRSCDKSASLAAVIAAMGCSFCFPAIASSGAAVGPGFLVQWEGILLTTLMPGVAILTLLVDVLGYFYHRQWYRSIPRVIGPITILLVLNFWFATYWRANALYAALGLMVAVSIWDILSPANRHCVTENAAKHEAECFHKPK